MAGAFSSAYYENEVALVEQRLSHYREFRERIMPLKDSSALYRDLFARNREHIEACEAKLTDFHARLADARARESGK